MRRPTKAVLVACGAQNLAKTLNAVFFLNYFYQSVCVCNTNRARFVIKTHPNIIKHICNFFGRELFMLDWCQKLQRQ